MHLIPKCYFQKNIGKENSNSISFKELDGLKRIDLDDLVFKFSNKDGSPIVKETIKDKRFVAYCEKMRIRFQETFDIIEKVKVVLDEFNKDESSLKKQKNLNEKIECSSEIP